jgi:esterase/lipase superfamily enzyme
VGILWIGYAVNDVMRFDPDTKDLFAADVGGMSYGVCTVTVPSSGRKIGELNGPFRAWIFEQPEDPKAHIILAKSLVLDKEAFLTQLAGSIAKADAKEAFVFIHGYNVSFEDAVRRTAQLAVDLRFVGAPICFSWPSYALESCYFLDVRNADASVSALQAFLHDVSERSGASRIHVIAHSMGNRVLTSACELDPTILGGPKSVIQHVVMAAPDVDKQLFVDRIAPKMTGSAAAVTLYGSSRDKALKLSKEFNGQPRAGDTEPEVTCLPGICSIDASAVDTSLLGHGYVAEERSLVSDLYYLFAGKQPAERFGMVEVKHAGGTYWRILE